MHQVISRLTLRTAALCLSLLAAGASAVAQNTPDLRVGNFELGLYGGGSYGVDSYRPMTGVNLSYSLPKLLLPYVEFSYFPELLRNPAEAGKVGTLSARIVDFHSGVHIRFTKRESRVVPYGVVGFGVLNSHTTGTTRPSDTSGFTPQQIAALTSNIDIRSNDPAVNFGGGLRYYQNSRMGFRAEYKLYRPVSGQFTKMFSKTEGGIFFQFGGR